MEAGWRKGTSREMGRAKEGTIWFFAGGWDGDKVRWDEMRYWRSVVWVNEDDVQVVCKLGLEVVVCDVFIHTRITFRNRCLPAPPIAPSRRK